LQTSQWNFELGLINSINGCVQKVGEPLVDETTHIVPLHCQQPSKSPIFMNECN